MVSEYFSLRIEQAVQEWAITKTKYVYNIWNLHVIFTTPNSLIK